MLDLRSTVEEQLIYSIVLPASWWRECAVVHCGRRRVAGDVSARRVVWCTTVESPHSADCPRPRSARPHGTNSWTRVTVPRGSSVRRGRCLTLPGARRPDSTKCCTRWWTDALVSSFRWAVSSGVERLAHHTLSSGRPPEHQERLH